jgi:hypothetical protein
MPAVLQNRTAPQVHSRVACPGENDEPAGNSRLTADVKTERSIVRLLWTAKTSVVSVAVASVLWTTGIVARQATQPSDRRNLMGVWELVSRTRRITPSRLLSWRVGSAIAPEQRKIACYDPHTSGHRAPPDGKWIAYESNGSGLSEVFMQRFAAPGKREQVST